MAFQAVPDTARFAVVMDDSEKDQFVNVFYFRRTGQWGLPELQQGATTLAQVWINDVLPYLMRFTRLLRVEARGERSQTDVSFQYVPPGQPVSNRAGEGLPYQVAFCVTHLTGLTGRYNRGRTYFGPLSENDQDYGLLLPAVANAFVAALGSMRTLMGDVGWEHVVVSRFFNRVRRAQGVTIPVIGYRYYDLVIDTQRRRQRGRGS
jgi:hypothetical protein